METERKNIKKQFTKNMKYAFLTIALSSSILAYGQTSKEYYVRGNAKLRNMEYIEAIQDFNKAISLNPKYGAAFNSRGFAKDALGDYRGAIKDYTAAIKLDWNSRAIYYNNRGLSKIALGERESGCLDLSKAGELGAFDAYDSIKEHCR